LPLGIDSAAVYEEQRVDLAPGEMLLVYSDGLSEAIDEAGQMFGDERVLDLAAHLDGMTATAAGQRVLTALADFAGRARPIDDLSLAVLRRTS
jgi:sigma-B regulation protein RsbU (phosphoserine phosphatase)